MCGYTHYLQKAGALTPLEMGYCGTWETVGTGDFLANNALAVHFRRARQNKISKIIGKITREKPVQPIGKIIPATVWKRTA
jgi:hypothetical protein